MWLQFLAKGFHKKNVASVHESKKPFECDICDYSFSQKNNMKTHVASVHEENKPFKCDKCDYSCSLKGSMKKHVASVHEGNKPVLWILWLLKALYQLMFYKWKCCVDFK